MPNVLPAISIFDKTQFTFLFSSPHCFFLFSPQLCFDSLRNPPPYHQQWVCECSHYFRFTNTGCYLIIFPYQKENKNNSNWLVLLASCQLIATKLLDSQFFAKLTSSLNQSARRLLWCRRSSDNWRVGWWRTQWFARLVQFDTFRLFRMSRGVLRFCKPNLFGWIQTHSVYIFVQFALFKFLIWCLFIEQRAWNLCMKKISPIEHHYLCETLLSLWPWKDRTSAVTKSFVRNILSFTRYFDTQFTMHFLPQYTLGG